MNDWIRMDTDETMSLAGQLEKLSDEMDRLSMRLRTADMYLSEPEASAALYSQRRRIHLLMDRAEQLARRLKQTTELFGDCEKQLKDWVYYHTDVYAKLPTVHQDEQ